MNNRKNTAFTVELLGLFILLTAVITIVTGVFVMTRAHSLQAKQLNEAVILAGNAAEISSAAADDDRLAGMLSAMDSSGADESFIFTDSEGNTGCAVFAKAGGAEGSLYLVSVSREYPDGKASERPDGGTYAFDTIRVYTADAADTAAADAASLGEPVYTLEAGTYFDSGSFTEGGRP